jgi:hypothetical protein
MRKIDLTGSIAKAADSAKNIAIIAGIAVTIFGLYKGYRELVMSARTQKLSNFGTVKELIKASEEQNANIKDVVAMKDSIPELLKKYGEVRRFLYESKEPVAVATVSVGHHYEQLGALVRLQYIDFDLVYEVVPFPDEFWDATAPIRAQARSNWFGGKPLPDFWKNFEYLKKRYETQRNLESKTAAH